MAKAYSNRNTKYDDCYHCEERTVGCHSTCEKYLKAKEEYDEIKKKVLEEKQKCREMRGVVSEAKHRMKTRRGNNLRGDKK